MSLVEFVIDKLDDLKGTEIVHFDVKGKSSIFGGVIKAGPLIEAIE